jgi:hypothetical protein
MYNDGQSNPECHFQSVTVAFQSNRKIRRNQMETDLLRVSQLYVLKNALAEIHLLIAAATVGTHLNPNAY